MAFSIKYARLFEVKILHGYHLDKGNAMNFFELDENVPDDMAFRKAVLERYDLLREGLLVQPTKTCRRLLEQHRMVFRPLPFGFMVGIEVNEEIQGNVSSLIPRINIAEDFAFDFKVTVKNPDWHNYSGVRINPNVPANYYFSNYEEVSEMTPPSLALKAAPRASRHYEMGEFVLDQSSGQLYQAKIGVESSTPLASTNHWDMVTDFHFVNGRNHILLPLRFAYTFTPDPADPITEASFALNDSANTQVANISTIGSGPFREYFLDFKALDVPEGRYTLQVSGNGGAYGDEIPVLLKEDLYESGSHFVVSIGHRAGLPDGLKLLESDGSLRKEGNETRPPVFEIRYPARKTYWRYFLHPNQGGLTAIFFDHDVVLEPDQVLVTKAPTPLTKRGSLVNYDDDTLLPNPTHLSIANGGNGQNGRLFSDIYLSNILDL